MGSSPLHPHPFGIKFWTSIWKANKDLPFEQVHQNFQNWYGNTFQRNFGRYFYAHRTGRFGTFAPLVLFMVGFKVATMFYGTIRDQNAATGAALAYGQGGYKCNAVPK